LFTEQKTKNKEVIKISRHVLTQNDLRILSELYQYGPMFPTHLKAVIDLKSEFYIYRRLRLLKEYGYMDQTNLYVPIEGYKRKRRKVGTMYYLLTKGVHGARKHLQVDLDRKVRIEKPAGTWMYYQYYLGRIRAELAPLFRDDNEWVPGKLVKQQLNLSDKIRIHALLKVNGFRYAVYNFNGARPENVAKIVTAQTKSINRLVDGHIVICPKAKQSEKLRSIFLQDSDFTNIRFLNYDNAVDVISELIRNDQHMRMINLIKERYPHVHINIEQTPNAILGIDFIPPGAYIGNSNRGSFFISELLTENMRIIKALRFFDGTAAQRCNLPSTAFVLLRDKWQENEYLKIINNKHVNFIY